MFTLLDALLSPESIRRKIVRRILLTFPGLQSGMTIDERIVHALTPRPHYAYCMLNGARLAKKLGYHRTSIIEFGVAGGAGLVAAETLSTLIERETGVGLDIYGFDMGSGLPAARDYRDMAYHWKSGYFRMDEAALRAKLRKSELILGPIADTVPRILQQDRFREAPISSVFFDVDLYSSTMDAFQVFEAPAETRLPRVFCYMDDIVGELERHSDFTGVLGAIAAFNGSHDHLKISRLHLGSMPDHRLRAPRLMMLHDFSHPLYSTFVGDEQKESELRL
jgi:hypothetical protein